jgi:hypothetical protein
MWHDCDSNCDSASRVGRDGTEKVKKARICVADAELSTATNAFFSATVAAMQQFWRDAAVDSAICGGITPAATQAASPATSFALSA